MKLRVFCLSLFCLVSLVLPVNKAFAKNNDYTWSNVAIGGGGYVTGIVIHPTEPDLMYIRTDVGGAFRWDPQNRKWIPLMESISVADRNLYGIDGIALDPNNPDVVYVAAGMYMYSEPYDVLKSTDRGATWQRTNLNKKFAGNGKWRYGGEMIAVDPANSNIIFVGTRSEGLYKSSNAAASWTQVTGVPSGTALEQSEVPGLPVDKDPVGIRTIAFDSASVKNGVTQTIYVSVTGMGIYKTSDAGETWSLLGDSPTLGARMQVSLDGTLYVTTLGQGVKKYYDGEWLDITPPDSENRYCGLSLDPTDANKVIVSQWRHNGVTHYLPIYRSNDKGASWTKVSVTAQDNRTSSPSWYPNWFFLACTSQVLFDPHNPGQLYATDWYAVWRTPDIWAEPTKTQWYAESNGHEETVVFTLSTPPSGAPLFSGKADVGGFRHTDLLNFPLSKLTGGANEINSIDYCEADPNYMAYSGSLTWDANGAFATSDDNGVTFTSKTIPAGARNGRVAYSSTNIDLIVWVPQNGYPIRSIDRGNTWQTTTGGPTGSIKNFWATNQPLAADKVNGNMFYLYFSDEPDDQSGFYRSTDGGATWSKINSQLPKVHHSHVKAAPGMEGEVWISMQEEGLYRSSDGGVTFSKVSKVQSARLVAFGKNPPGKSNPAVFLYGEVDGVQGIFRSDDMGAKWLRIDSDDTRIGNAPAVMEGDRQTFGRVYIATGGSGIYYGEPAGSGLLPGKGKTIVKIDGKEVDFPDQKPVIMNDHTKVIMQTILEELGKVLGVDIDWVEAGQTINIITNKPVPTPTPTPGSPAVIIVDDADQMIKYTGTWTHENDSNFLQGTKSVTFEEGASAELEFTGTGIAVYTKKMPHGATFEVYIDGILHSTVDTYNIGDLYKQKVFQKTDLSNGSHTIKIVSTGKATASATGAIGLDYFEIQ